MVARRWVKPRRRNRKCRWVWSAWKTFSPYLSRRATTNVVSTIGTASTSNGKKSVTGEPVQAIEEVEHVHDRNDPDDAERHSDPLRQHVHADHREREAMHPDPEADRDRRSAHLP